MYFNLPLALFIWGIPCAVVFSLSPCHTCVGDGCSESGVLKPYTLEDGIVLNNTSHIEQCHNSEITKKLWIHDLMLNTKICNYNMMLNTI